MRPPPPQKYNDNFLYFYFIQFYIFSIYLIYEKLLLLCTSGTIHFAWCTYDALCYKECNKNSDICDALYKVKHIFRISFSKSLLGIFKFLSYQRSYFVQG